MQTKLPMKPSLVYSQQFNLRIEKELKDAIRDLIAHGVDVSALLRPAVRDLITQAKKQVESQAS